MLRQAVDTDREVEPSSVEKTGKRIAQGKPAQPRPRKCRLMLASLGPIAQLARDQPDGDGEDDRHRGQRPEAFSDRDEEADRDERYGGQCRPPSTERSTNDDGPEETGDHHRVLHLAGNSNSRQGGSEGKHGAREHRRDLAN